MSRRHDAKRKEKRRQARTAAEPTPRGRFGQLPGPRRLAPLLPILAIAAILVVVGMVGFGGDSGARPNREQVRQEVTGLLADVPQSGATLGSPDAPVTIWMFADLECPTVKLFAESYLPSVLDTWVRTGVAKLTYRSLQTDTYNEEIFFRQETAALAAGRQDKMWDFALTYILGQGTESSEYATDEFLAGIASQVPGLSRARWRQDRKDALLSRQVALSVYSGHSREFRSTPSFSVGLSDEESGRTESNKTLLREVEASLKGHVESLKSETSRDVPSIGDL